MSREEMIQENTPQEVFHQKTTILFVRHGFSVANAKEEFSGISNVSLAPLGHLQAKCTADYLRAYSIDVLYSSDLLRAVETAQPISDLTGLPIHEDSGLREINGGDWEGLSIQTLWKDHCEAFTRWRNDKINAQCPNGESTKEMQARILASVNRIVAENLGKTICIVSHGAAIWAITNLWWDPKQDCPEPMPYAPNASVSIAEYDGKTYRLLQYGIAEHLANCGAVLKDNVSL